VPTRRELASYGIKLPSQRMAEEKARESEYEDDADEMQQDELARQFARSRISATVKTISTTNLRWKTKMMAEAELARQFAATQQQRYSGEQPAGQIRSRCRI
jgi:S-DNA-T family DNA segregation ATPase FtsK/SpoIIIE